jgi:hypothetical protein
MVAIRPIPLDSGLRSRLYDFVMATRHQTESTAMQTGEVPGCPNYQPTVEQVERVLCSESLQAEIRSIAVRTMPRQGS